MKNQRDINDCMMFWFPYCFSLRSRAVRSRETSFLALRNSSLVLHNYTSHRSRSSIQATYHQSSSYFTHHSPGEPRLPVPRGFSLACSGYFSPDQQCQSAKGNQALTKPVGWPYPFIIHPQMKVRFSHYAGFPTPAARMTPLLCYQL